jgi:hypothetical protein
MKKLPIHTTMKCMTDYTASDSRVVWPRCFIGAGYYLGARRREVSTRVLSSRNSATSAAGSAGCSFTSFPRRIGLHVMKR